MLNRRQYERFSFKEPVGYQKEGDFLVDGALAEDISQIGLKLRVNQFVPLNSILELQLQLPGLNQLVPVRAKVVRIKQVPFDDECWELGLEMILDTLSSSVIRRYINLRAVENF